MVCVDRPIKYQYADKIEWVMEIMGENRDFADDIYLFASTRMEEKLR